MSTIAASSRPIDQSPAVGRPGGLGHVLLFAGLSVTVAAAATLTGNIVPPELAPFVLAFAPTLFALALAWREGRGAVRRLLATAATRPDRRAWYALVALPLAWALAVVGVTVALGESTAGLFADLFPRIAFIVLLVLLPAFAEEIAWRGYAITRLTPSMSPLAAALVVGVPWAVLHLFLQLPGQMNAGLEAWPTILSLIAYSVVLTWAFVGSGGSVLLTALVHAGFNGVAPLMANLETDRAWIVRAVVAAGIAVLVVIVSRRMRQSPTDGGHPTPAA